MSKALVQVFLKSPEPGKVKTRLIPAVGVARAIEIHIRLVEKVLHATQSLSDIDTECWVAGDQSVNYIRTLADRFPLRTQKGADLGENMYHAFCAGLESYDKVVIVGGDAYSICAEYILQALLALEGNDTVLGPAEDGGYILIGCKKIHHHMFDGIHWGTPSVLEEQISRLSAVGLSHKRLEKRWDIDDISDIERYAPELLQDPVSNNQG